MKLAKGLDIPHINHVPHIRKIEANRRNPQEAGATVTFRDGAEILQQVDVIVAATAEERSR